MKKKFERIIDDSKERDELVVELEARLYHACAILCDEGKGKRYIIENQLGVTHGTLRCV